MMQGTMSLKFNKLVKDVASGWLIYLNCMMMHRPANV